jgi:hypothetical protein
MNPDLNPSKSIIEADFHENCMSGSPTEELLQSLNELIKDEIGNSRSYVVGYACAEYADARFKQYEKHEGLDVHEILVIYTSSSLRNATYVESELIKRNINLDLNRNKRMEKMKKGSGDHDEYYVYIAMSL